MRGRHRILPACRVPPGRYPRAGALWQGAADENVLVATGHYLARVRPNCTATICPGEGHLAAVRPLAGNSRGTPAHGIGSHAGSRGEGDTVDVASEISAGKASAGWGMPKDAVPAHGVWA